jgi:Protein of unknown function (DUF2934)
MSTSHVTTARNTRRKSAMAVVSAGKPGFVAAAAAQPAQWPPIDPETKRLMVAEAAYYCAEKRGFAPGGELEDWLEAEAQLEAVLGN